MDKKLVRYSVVDAFTDSAFKGNPAAVCFLEEDRDEEWLQAVASEFNISETCYLTRLPNDDSPNPRFRLRWFTPVAEIQYSIFKSIPSFTSDSLFINSMDKKLVRYSVVDAFTDSAFKGNPAAVCLLEEDRDEEWLQAVASEFNISETCYLTRLPNDDSPNPTFRLRWFTPVAEVELCGHATLAAAHTLFSRGLVSSDIIEFATLSGILTAKKVPDVKAIKDSNLQSGEAQECYFIELDFPTVPITDFNYAEVSLIHKALAVSSVVDMKKTTTSEDIFVVLPSAKSVADLQPQFDEIQKCPGNGIIVSGLAPPESGFDFYSRFFCPKFGINEDPVCGSAHCALATYWSQKLGKFDFVAYAASPRSGILNIHFDEQNQRVKLQGKAITVMEGTLLV